MDYIPVSFRNPEGDNLHDAHFAVNIIKTSVRSSEGPLVGAEVNFALFRSAPN